MHAINTSDHPWKPPHLTDMQNFLQVILSWSSEILLLIQIPLQKRRKHSNVVVSPILIYSSIALAATPYANIHMTVVHFANGEIPSLFVASTHWVK